MAKTAAILFSCVESDPLGRYLGFYYKPICTIPIRVMLYTALICHYPYLHAAYVQNLLVKAWGCLDQRSVKS